MGVLLQLARRAAADGRVDAREVGQLTARARDLVDAHGRVTPTMQRDLADLEREVGDAFTGGARRRYQTFVAGIGAKTTLPIDVPAERTPYWLTGPHPLAGFRSTPKLPTKADVIIVGMGLTGASAAYHAAIAAEQRGLKVVVVDMGDPATQASGYNGYGGSYTTAAGMAAAQMALDGDAPDFVPEDIFSPTRFGKKEPLFKTTASA